ncbi:MAG: TetR/AcrR family transcriptional regulator [Verrucomicrobiae bacterium]|nr:TetR/AcrR family transcriptional regulator [Verrucomicrobiae bacterium]
MNETKIKILEAAEAELAEFGFAGASIRNITQRAGVNVASINYHFGSKVELIKELFKYRIMPLNDLRLNLLREEESLSESGIVPVPRLVEIMVRPVVGKLMSKEGRRFVQAMARCMSEPMDFMTDLDEEIFQEVFSSFLAALQKAMPDLSPQQAVAKLNFIVCSMVGFMMHFPRIDRFVRQEMSKDEFDALLDQYIDFISQGIQGAPVTVAE